MPRSFLVKKYLKQKYDEDQIKLQQQQQQQQQQMEQEQMQQCLQTLREKKDLDNNHGLVGRYCKDITVNNIIINNNNNNSISKPSPYSKDTNQTSAPSDHMTTLDIRLINGYMHEVAHLYDGGNHVEVNDFRTVSPLHPDAMSHNYYQPRRSVIVTNSNHPANRSIHDNDTFQGYEAIHSPHLPTDQEQNAPYDYSIRRQDRPPSPSPSGRSGPSASPVPAHTASSGPAHKRLPSPPPAHQGIEPHYPAPSSPQGTPPHEFLPADHPFNHPLIQQLINQRLHVPGEKNPDSNSNSNSGISSDHSRDDMAVEENDYHHNSHYYHHHHHYRHHETTREYEAMEPSPGRHNVAPFPLASPPHSTDTASSDYQFYPSNTHTTSFPTTLTPSHLSPLQSYPHPNSFPPSPSPTIPSSSPTLPNAETKSYFILPPPSSPSSDDTPMPPNCPTPEKSPKPQPSETDDDASSTGQNSYTYEAFLISDGRSRKRSFEETEIKTPGRMRYTCNECGKDYATSSNLSRHKQTHRALDSKSAKKCPHCDKVYVSMPALSMHILTHDLKHACDVCGKTFSRPWLLQGHMRSHTGEKPFGCAHCGKAFADRSNLRAHMQTHSAFKHFACTKCNKTFALKSYLNKHLESSCVKVE